MKSVTLEKNDLSNRGWTITRPFLRSPLKMNKVWYLLCILGQNRRSIQSAVAGDNAPLRYTLNQVFQKWDIQMEGDTTHLPETGSSFTTYGHNFLHTVLALQRGGVYARHL